MTIFSNAKKEIATIIMRAELISKEAGVSVAETLLEYSKELKKEKEISSALEKISKRISSGVKRKEAYKKYLDDDILGLLKIAEDNSIPAGDIFSQYAPIKSMSDGFIKSIRSSIKTPVGIFILLTTIFSFVLSNLYEITSLTEKSISDAGTFVAENYAYINIAMLILFLYLFYSIPDKIPLLKPVFMRLRSLLALSTMSILFKVGYSSSEIIPLMQKQFNLKRKKKEKRNANSLVGMLADNDILTPVEGADLKIGIRHGAFDDSLQVSLSNKLKDIENLGKEISKIMESLSIVLTAFPILLALFVIAEILLLITSMSGG